jgi:hypothetical protein
MSDNNYFDMEQEDVVHDVFLMVKSDKTDYECIEDVLLGETSFTENALGFGDWYEE